MPNPGNWLPFEEARNIVVLQKFRRQTDFQSWDERPANIPSNPREVYKQKGWKGWAYFLGTGAATERAIAPAVPFLPYDEAKKLVQPLMQSNGIRNQSAWNRWAQSKAKPRQIPADPSSTYRNKGWVSWPDWFGREPTRASGREVVKTFQEAREFARSLGIKSSTEWATWAKSPDRPADIPRSPESRYADEGWIGWGDFLGVNNQWNHHSIIAFLTSLEPCIELLTELDLYLILSQNGMLRRDARRRSAKVLRGLIGCCSSEDVRKKKEQFATELAAAVSEKDLLIKDDKSSNELLPQSVPGDPDSSLRRLDVLEAIKAVDRVVDLKLIDDPEVLNFMIEERVAMLWQEVMGSDEASVFNRPQSLPAGEYATAIRKRFSDHFNEVKAFSPPTDFRMVDGMGAPVELNLMQRLTGYRLLHEKRLGNWSGVGAGKTYAAVFAAAVVGAKLTLVIAAKATLAAWKTTIRRAFPSDLLHIHDGRAEKFAFVAGKNNFLVINYESFQQTWSADFVRGLTEQNVIDLIVFDEVQFARQRHNADSRASARRVRLNSLVKAAIAKNSSLRILAMSATPVVNNLTEAVKVLELILPEQDFSQVPVGASIANAIGIHFLLKKHGIRYLPKYNLELKKRAIAVDGQNLLAQLLQIRPRDILQLEQTLLLPKLSHLKDWVRRGTLIYTHYVEGIVGPLKKAVEDLGFKPRLFTGKERVSVDEFVNDFRKKQADVLIGSAPVGTGVDGLQTVLDRVLFITLPWSNAEYEQIIGRLWRQGSKAKGKKVEVFIPQVTLRQEVAGQWSWDDLRLQCIEYKKTLADAAMDGTIPGRGLPSKEEMQRQSLEALKSWAERVRRGLPQSEAVPT